MEQVFQKPAGETDAPTAVFQGLAQDFGVWRGGIWRVVEEEDAVVGDADFAGGGDHICSGKRRGSLYAPGEL